MSDAIKQQFWQILQAQILRLDQQAFIPLHSHQGKTLLLRVSGLLSLPLQINDNGISVLPHNTEIGFDTVFSAPLSAYMKGLMAKNPPAGVLDIKGDLALAEAFLNVWQQMQPDWEGFVASIFGDTVAVTLSKVAQHAHSWLSQTIEHRQADAVAFLQDEIQWLPMPHVVEALYTQIDEIRADVDRLQVRLKRLQETTPC